jgi:hypothetical protein
MGEANQGVVVPFRRTADLLGRLTISDRAAALQWADRASQHGYSRIVLDRATEGSGHEPGDFMLIYPRDAVWARRGIGCSPSGLTLWNAANGVTVGTFMTMAETLAALPFA